MPLRVRFLMHAPGLRASTALAPFTHALPQAYARGCRRRRNRGGKRNRQPDCHLLVADMVHLALIASEHPVRCPRWVHLRNAHALGHHTLLSGCAMPALGAAGTHFSPTPLPHGVCSLRAMSPTAGWLPIPAVLCIMKNGLLSKFYVFQVVVAYLCHAMTRCLSQAANP